MLNKKLICSLLSLTICSFLLTLECLRLYPMNFIINIVLYVPCLQLSPIYVQNALKKGNLNEEANIRLHNFKPPANLTKIVKKG